MIGSDIRGERLILDGLLERVNVRHRSLRLVLRWGRSKPRGGFRDAGDTGEPCSSSGKDRETVGGCVVAGPSSIQGECIARIRGTAGGHSGRRAVAEVLSASSFRNQHPDWPTTALLFLVRNSLPSCRDVPLLRERPPQYLAGTVRALLSALAHGGLLTTVEEVDSPLMYGDRHASGGYLILRRSQAGLGNLIRARAAHSESLITASLDHLRRAANTRRSIGLTHCQLANRKQTKHSGQRDFRLRIVSSVSGGQLPNRPRSQLVSSALQAPANDNKRSVVGAVDKENDKQRVTASVWSMPNARPRPRAKRELRV